MCSTQFDFEFFYRLANLGVVTLELDFYRVPDVILIAVYSNFSDAALSSDTEEPTNAILYGEL